MESSQKLVKPIPHPQTVLFKPEAANGMSSTKLSSVLVGQLLIQKSQRQV
jgi:hypothetical protein